MAYFILWLVLVLMSITWWRCNVATFGSLSLLSDERPHVDRLCPSILWPSPIHEELFIVIQEALISALEHIRRRRTRCREFQLLCDDSKGTFINNVVQSAEEQHLLL